MCIMDFETFDNTLPPPLRQNIARGVGNPGTSSARTLNDHAFYPAKRPGPTQNHVEPNSVCVSVILKRVYLVYIYLVTPPSQHRELPLSLHRRERVWLQGVHLPPHHPRVHVPGV